MAEAEDVLHDVARHATIFARDFWRKHRKNPPGPARLALKDIAQRLDLLLSAVFGRSFPLRIAEPPPPATFIAKVFRRGEGPRVDEALPATDGHSIWLPGVLTDRPRLGAAEAFRTMALSQATRATRRSAEAWTQLTDPLERALFLVFEAHAADSRLVQMLPGMLPLVQAHRAEALALRPALHLFPPHRRVLEERVRHVLTLPLVSQDLIRPAEGVLALAREEAARLPSALKGRVLFRDAWTGEFRGSSGSPTSFRSADQQDPERESPTPPRSAKLDRAPQVRDAPEDEDDKKQGAWMVQTGQPMEKAEDPVGMQRPTDRDESTASEELADSLSELPEARLVSSPGRPKEILLSEDPPEARAKRAAEAVAGEGGLRLHYPEWDHRCQSYAEDGVTVHLRTASEGPQEWVKRTLDEHRTMLNVVRRRFEMLKAQRVKLRKQFEGEDVDLEAYIDGYADFRAGLPMPQALYQTYRQSRRDMAILILTDISGSTDGWISTNKRIVDVEREALLLVAIALQGMNEPSALQAFSGEGPRGVTVRDLKRFDEPFSETIARRIASLEPEHYTRAGAALRHSTATLMEQAARHRLLLVLSDGKPNDIDDYEGQYGVEDMRQAVTEARLQGINCFCLTVDRQAAGYLPGIFGAHQYALLPRPELLPTVLLDWMKRLVTA